MGENDRGCVDRVVLTVRLQRHAEATEEARDLSLQVRALEAAVTVTAIG